MGFFHQPLNPPMPIPASNAKKSLRGHQPKTAHKEVQSSKADRRFHVRPRRSIKPRHDELVDADPVVQDCFEMLQTAWRHQKIKNLVAPIRRELMLQRERDRERRAWVRLMDYLGSRFD